MMMQKTIDVPEDILSLMENKSQSMGMSVAAILRYAVRRFAIVDFPIEDEFALCAACRRGEHCEGKSMFIQADPENRKRGMGRERRIRWVCLCKHCREELGIPLPAPAEVDQYGKLLDATGVAVE